MNKRPVTAIGKNIKYLTFPKIVHQFSALEVDEVDGRGPNTFAKFLNRLRNSSGQSLNSQKATVPDSGPARPKVGYLNTMKQLLSKVLVFSFVGSYSRFSCHATIRFSVTRCAF